MLEVPHPPRIASAHAGASCRKCCRGRRAGRDVVHVDGVPRVEIGTRAANAKIAEFADQTTPLPV